MDVMENKTCDVVGVVIDRTVCLSVCVLCLSVCLSDTQPSHLICLCVCLSAHLGWTGLDHVFESFA